MGILMSPEDKARWNELCDGLKEAIKNVDAAICEVALKIFAKTNEEERAAIEQMHDEALAKANEEAAAEAVPFDVMLEKLEAFGQEIHSITKQEAAMFWCEDARLFSEKMAARQNEVTRAMENESARQAMKRRKLLHSEGSFPDLAR